LYRATARQTERMQQEVRVIIFNAEKETQCMVLEVHRQFWKFTDSAQYKKVKQSRYRPGVAQRVPGS